MINVDWNEAPVIFGESSTRKASYVDLNALKGIHVSFNGYGIAEGDVVIFPTAEEFKANPKKFIKTMPTYEGSKNKSAFFKVNRNGRVSWLNLSVLSRQAFDEEGNRIDIDDFRTEMRAMNDDAERVSALLGHTLTGNGTFPAYRALFGQDHKPTGEYEEYDYVTIENSITEVEKPAEKPKGK